MDCQAIHHAHVHSYRDSNLIRPLTVLYINILRLNELSGLRNNRQTKPRQAGPPHTTTTSEKRLKF